MVYDNKLIAGGGFFTTVGDKVSARIVQWTKHTSCCDKAGDANNDLAVNIGDAVYIINYIFKGGPAPICGPG